MAEYHYDEKVGYTEYRNSGYQYAGTYTVGTVEGASDKAAKDDLGGQFVPDSSSKAGDQMNVRVWIILLAVCVAGAAAVFGVKFYRNKKQK